MNYSLFPKILEQVLKCLPTLLMPCHVSITQHAFLRSFLKKALLLSTGEKSRQVLICFTQILFWFNSSGPVLFKTCIGIYTQSRSDILYELKEWVRNQKVPAMSCITLLGLWVRDQQNSNPCYGQAKHCSGWTVSQRPKNDKPLFCSGITLLNWNSGPETRKLRTLRPRSLTPCCPSYR